MRCECIYLAIFSSHFLICSHFCLFPFNLDKNETLTVRRRRPIAFHGHPHRPIISDWNFQLRRCMRFTNGARSKPNDKLLELGNSHHQRHCQILHRLIAIYFVNPVNLHQFRFSSLTSVHRFNEMKKKNKKKTLERRIERIKHENARKNKDDKARLCLIEFHFALLSPGCFCRFFWPLLCEVRHFFSRLVSFALGLFCELHKNLHFN